MSGVPNIVTTRGTIYSPISLHGRRVVLRTLTESDYPSWIEVRQRCHDWLLKWEPRSVHSSHLAEDQRSFASRCSLRERERQLGTGFGFGIFHQGRFIGEITLSSVQRGPLQSAYIGYWIDEAVAGQGLMPEAVVTMLQYAFDTLRLHRVEINIIPRNVASRRVVEKLGVRCEGVAERYLEIDGAWEDHARYAVTAEEWAERAPELVATWLLPRND
jgi:ribosomal-protein-alanine N-acetyltransferase